MNPKISGQSSKSNYKNTGSSAGAVLYDEHDLRDFLESGQELGIEEQQMRFFDMDGHVVTGDEVKANIDRHHSGLHKGDAKFFCLMLDPSDPEIASMGESLSERLSNGQQYVFDIMDAYARNFHREGVKDRHNLVAYAIPHLYKGKEKKKQIHWHIVVARKDASNKYKLSPMTNHRNTARGAVIGGFDRQAFDFECERLFDKRFGYERKVEESFLYCLAQKKGTPEQKAKQTQRLAEQNKPNLEAAVNAFLNHRVAQLEAEAAARAKRRQTDKEEEDQKYTAVDRQEFADRKMKSTVDGNNRDAAGRKLENSIKTAIRAYARKAEILSIFKTSGDAISLHKNLVDHGLSFREIKSPRGVVDITISANGETPFDVNVSNFGIDYHHLILGQLHRITGQIPAYKTEIEIERAQRVRMAQNANRHVLEIRSAQEVARREAQRQALQKQAQEAAKQEVQRRSIQDRQNVLTTHKGKGGPHR